MWGHCEVRRRAQDGSGSPWPFGSGGHWHLSAPCRHGAGVNPGSIPVNATMDSEDRFYATLFAAYGVALLWCVRDTDRKSKVVYFLAATFFVGGLARLVSIAVVGFPNGFFKAMTVLELLIPIFMVLMQSRIAKAANAEQDYSQSRP